MLMRPLYAIFVVLSCCVVVVAKLDLDESLQPCCVG
jgi:hypothetical protein